MQRLAVFQSRVEGAYSTGGLAIVAAPSKSEVMGLIRKHLLGINEYTINDLEYFTEPELMEGVVYTGEPGVLACNYAIE